MKRLLLILLLLAWLATGFFVVKGNEKAVVRRFGRVVRTEAGAVALKGSGLHYELPWPLSQIDRINLNEIRTLVIGSLDVEETEGNLGDFLRSADAMRQSQFLTGDKNILNLQVTVQYRISERNPDDYLFRSESVERQLQMLVEVATADLVSRSGVDFVHPLGLVELRDLLTGRVRELVEAHRLGIDVEEASISAVQPPTQVKQAFLAVSDARAARERIINDAYAYAEQRRARAQAEARQVLDEAEIYRRDLVEAARGSADRFSQIVAQFDLQEQQGVQTRGQARRMAMRRLYLETMEDVLRRVDGKVYLDSGKEVDLTIFRDPKR